MSGAQNARLHILPVTDSTPSNLIWPVDSNVVFSCKVEVYTTPNQFSIFAVLDQKEGFLNKKKTDKQYVIKGGAFIRENTENEQYSICRARIPTTGQMEERRIRVRTFPLTSLSIGRWTSKVLKFLQLLDPVRVVPTLLDQVQVVLTLEEKHMLQRRRLRNPWGCFR